MDLEVPTDTTVPSDSDDPVAPVDPVDPVDPVEVDVELAVAAQRRLGATELTRSSEPERACGRCRHFLNPGHDLAFCWHPAQRSLVDAGWVCTAFAPDETDLG